MSGQPASQTKATWWSVTAYNDEILLLEDNSNWPPNVAKVYGGREECPTTHRLHYQGAIQFRSNVRMSQVKAWLPTAHLETARGVEALKKYAMKTETAVGEKKVLQNTIPYFPHHEVCKLLALEADYALEEDVIYWSAVRKVLLIHPYLSATLANSSLKTFWIKTCLTWRQLASSGANSITPRPDTPIPEQDRVDGDSESDSESICSQCMSNPHHKTCDLISHA